MKITRILKIRKLNNHVRVKLWNWLLLKWWHNRWKRMSETEKLEYISLSIVTKSHIVHLIFFFCHQCEEINSLWIFLLQPSTIQHLSLMCAEWCGLDNTKVLSAIGRGHLAKAKGMETSIFWSLSYGESLSRSCGVPFSLAVLILLPMSWSTLGIIISVLFYWSSLILHE